jgi:hypothetical protein
MGRDHDQPKTAVGRANVASETMLVTLRLDLATDTISGTLADERGNERPFWGWLELSTALDETRDSDSAHKTSIRVRDPV